MAKEDKISDRLQSGQKFVSNLGTNLRLTVKKVDDMSATLVVERRTIDRSTGEVKIENRERVVDLRVWSYMRSAYGDG